MTEKGEVSITHMQASFLFLYILFTLGALGIEHMASCMLGKLFTRVTFQVLQVPLNISSGNYFCFKE